MQIARKLTRASLSSITTNLWIARNRLNRRKSCIFQLHAANQLPHIFAVLKALATEPRRSDIAFAILVSPDEIATTKELTSKISLPLHYSSYHSTTLLIFWDVLIAIDQRMRTPVLNLARGKRICMFHGQPTKGNVFAGFNFAGFDALFLYGPLMRSHYQLHKTQHPEWRNITLFNVGQPKTDELFDRAIDRKMELSALGLDPAKQTVLYGPSFESCASLARDGQAIITALHSLRCNVIVKPHPSFYRHVNESDRYFYGVPHAAEWRDRAKTLSKGGSIAFPIEEQLDTRACLQLADVLVTDHSGIAFEAIICDKPIVFYDCPDFFFHYLPERFGIDGQAALNDDACNAGRRAGEVVRNPAELISAVQINLAKPDLHAADRATMREKLLYNAGHATSSFIETLLTQFDRDERTRSN